MPPDATVKLREAFVRIEVAVPGVALPLHTKPAAKGRWIVKGDRFHRPDNPLSGTAAQLSDVTDPNRCGVLFQEWCDAKATIMVIGRRDAAGGVVLGAVRVLDERFFWDDILQAGETVDEPEVLEKSLTILEAIDHRGFFTVNWLITDSGPRLSSFRPVPRAVFQAFRRGAADLMEPAAAVKVAPAGIRFIADPHYAALERSV